MTVDVTPLPKGKPYRSKGSIESYKLAHPWCEICGVPCYKKDPHHIKTRGSGGGDEWDNLIRLCTEHHGMAHAGNISKDELRRVKNNEGDLVDTQRFSRTFL